MHMGFLYFLTLYHLFLLTNVCCVAKGCTCIHNPRGLNLRVVDVMYQFEILSVEKVMDGLVASYKVITCGTR